MRAFFGTSAQSGLSVSLSQDGLVAAAVSGAPTGDALELLDLALKRARVSRSALKEIAVDRGPDGFSAVRRRIAVATALARALDAGLCAVEGASSEEVAALPSSAFVSKQAVVPLYAAPPNITATTKKKTWNAR